MDYNFQQIVSTINVTAEVPSSILGQEYCYRAVLTIGYGRIIAGILIQYMHGAEIFNTLHYIHLFG